MVHEQSGTILQMRCNNCSVNQIIKLIKTLLITGDTPNASRLQSPRPPMDMKFSGFDATAYERAAKAIKEIDKSSKFHIRF